MTENHTPKRIRGGHKVLAHLIAHPDVPFTLEQLADATGWTPTSIPTAFTRFQAHYPNLVRVGRGLYMWKSDPDVVSEPEPEPEEEEVPDEMLVSVLRRKDGTDKLLVQDTNGGALYVMTPFSF